MADIFVAIVAGEEGAGGDAMCVMYMAIIATDAGKE